MTAGQRHQPMPVHVHSVWWDFWLTFLPGNNTHYKKMLKVPSWGLFSKARTDLSTEPPCGAEVYPQDSKSINFEELSRQRKTNKQNQKTKSTRAVFLSPLESVMKKERGKVRSLKCQDSIWFLLWRQLFKMCCQSSTPICFKLY